MERLQNAGSMEKEPALVFHLDEHQTSLQKQLHKQWVNGHNCDLVIIADMSEFPVHSCVVSCFSKIICNQLLKSSLASALAAEEPFVDQETDVRFSLLVKSGEKRVETSIHEGIMKLLLEFIYTGTLHVAHHQTLQLLSAAQKLGVTVLISAIQIYVNRNAATFSSGASTHPDLLALVTGDGSETGTQANLLASVELLPSRDPPDSDLAALLHTVCIKQENEVRILNTDAPPSKRRKHLKRNTKTTTAWAHSDSDSDHFGDIVMSESDREQPDAEANDKNKNISNVGSSPAESGEQSCRRCRISFTSKRSLMKHKKLEHSLSFFSQIVCPHCDEEFDNAEAYKFHCKGIHRDAVCEEKGCTYRSKTQKNMKTHTFTRHSQSSSSSVCNVCKLDLKCEGKLAKHYNLLHSVRQCLLCQEMFEGQLNLTHHRNTMHADIKCPLCDKVCTKQHLLDQHILSKHKGLNTTDTVSDSGNDSNVKSAKVEKKSRSGMANSKKKSQAHRSSASHGKTRTVGQDAEQCGAQEAESCDPSELTGGGHSDLVNADQASKDLPVKTAVKSKVKRSGRKTAGKRKRRPSRIKWCQLCNKQLDCGESESLYSEHLRQVHPSESYACDQCPRAFVRTECLTRHKHRDHLQRHFDCPDCQQRFDRGSTYKEHCVSQHNNQKPFHCSTQTCSYHTSTIKLLTQHEKMQHPKNKPSVCPKCGGTFKYPQLHQINCLKLQNHLCPVCGSVFPSRVSLRSHIQVVHNGERPFVCRVCQRRFSCRSNLVRHMRIHNNAFPYSCSACGKAFRYSSMLKEHQERIHHMSTGSSHTCDLCSQQFRLRSSLKEHKKSVHSVYTNRAGRSSNRTHSHRHNSDHGNQAKTSHNADTAVIMPHLPVPNLLNFNSYFY